MFRMVLRQAAGLDQRAVRLVPFERRPLEIRHELLNRRFGDRIDRTRAEPGQEVFGELAIHGRDRTGFPSVHALGFDGITRPDPGMS
jgi:hypothetical protein